MNSEDSKLFDDLDTFSTPTKDLQSLTDLAVELVHRSNLVGAAKEALRLAQLSHEELSQKVIPSVMDAMGISDLTLEDGSKIGVETFYQASIPETDRDKAFAWLDAQGHAAIIKHEVKLSLQKGQLEEAELASKLLRDAGLEPTVDMKVHPSTLRAFAREEIEAGRPLDPSINVFVGRRTKLK
jgi:hypothetical protein